MLFCRKSTNKHFKIHRRYTGDTQEKEFQSKKKRMYRGQMPKTPSEKCGLLILATGRIYSRIHQARPRPRKNPLLPVIAIYSRPPSNRGTASEGFHRADYDDFQGKHARIRKHADYELVEQPKKMLVLEDIRSAEQWDETGVALSSTLDGTVSDDQSKPKASSNSAMFTKCDWKHFGIMLSYLRRQLMKNIVFIS